jgi:hypothetical protein
MESKINPNTGAYDYFGYSIAISGDTVVVGAGDEDSNATAIVSANIGCITHLQQEKMPVLHWVEIIDQLLVDTAQTTRSHSK